MPALKIRQISLATPPHNRRGHFLALSLLTRLFPGAAISTRMERLANLLASSFPSVLHMREEAGCIKDFDYSSLRKSCKRGKCRSLGLKVSRESPVASEVLKKYLNRQKSFPRSTLTWKLHSHLCKLIPLPPWACLPAFPFFSPFPPEMLTKSLLATRSDRI